MQENNFFTEKTMIARSSSILSLYFVLVCPFPVWAQPSFTMNGSAVVISENCYRLTSHNSSNDVGSIWCEYPIQLQNSLEIHFAINLGCSKYAGEGLAFVMHSSKSGYDALGCPGAALGFGESPDCPNVISPSIAIEFDTKYSAQQADIYVPHLTVIRNGNFKEPLTKATRIRTNGQDVRDCEYHDVRITWSPSRQELSVYFDGELRLSYLGDIASFFGEDKNIYIGFTGSTNGQANMQMVCVQSIEVNIDEEFERKRSFEEGVGIYPNPIRERLTIDIGFSEEKYVQIQLFDVVGKLIYEIPTHAVRENQYYFNLPGLPSGIYYVTVTNGEHRVSKKIVHIATIRA